MRKNKNYIFVGVGLILVLGLLVYLIRNQGNDWSQTFDDKSTEPYGTLVIKQLLKKQSAGFNFKEINKSSKVFLDSFSQFKNQNYIFLGGGLWLDSLETKQLINFVEKGNNAFICTYNIPQSLNDRLARPIENYTSDSDDFVETSDSTENPARDSIKQIQLDSVRNLAIVGPRFEDIISFSQMYADSLKLSLLYPNFKTDSARQNAISYKSGGKIYPEFYPNLEITNFKEADSVIALGSQKGFANYQNSFNQQHASSKPNFQFVKIKLGNGALYLHVTPLVFTNYYLRDSVNIAYAQNAFSHLPRANVIWDSKNRFSREYVRTKNRSSNNFIERDSPLSYILQQPALRSAWFLLLGLVIVYIVFTSKRKQRLVPVINTPQNENLKLLQLLAQKSWHKKEYNATAFELFQQFQRFVKKRYRMEFDDKSATFVQKLSESSNIPAHVIEKITQTYFSSISVAINERELAEMFQSLRTFYNKSV